MNQPTIDDLKNELKGYSSVFRHPNLPEFNLSGIYDLYPELNSDTNLGWPSDWPYATSAGVYIILSEDFIISYIGKASMNSSIATRLGTYFGYDENKGCRLKHPDSWKLKPRFVAVIPMENWHRYEAPALEEYLIEKLRPPDNKAGLVNAVL